MSKLPRTAGQGRPSYLDNDAIFEIFCQAEASGMTREQALDLILEETGTEVKQVKTVSEWRKNPRVKRRVAEITRERAIKVAREIDTELERRMAEADKIPTEVLLKMRKEFVGDNLRAKLDEADENTVGEMRDWAAENPDLAKALADSFFSGKE